MKQYQLTGWPELPAAYHRIAYRRMLHQMSQRPVSLHQLVRDSGLRRRAVRGFLDTLSEQALLVEGDGVPAAVPSLWARIQRRWMAVTPR